MSDKTKPTDKTPDATPEVTATPVKPPRTASTRGRKPVDENEKADARFARLATFRVSVALKAIRGIGMLSGKSYEYTPAQVAKVFAALETAVSNAHVGFENADKEKAAAFTL